jgi:Reverse transcriptase (RNA-dependent DNA polymerase)
MLTEGQLTPSLCNGVIRLIPKVNGIPTAAQLRPITLLNTDYKLLTKMFVARIVPLLPTVLQSSQLCSVQGRSIFDGGLAILSAIQYLEQRQLPGFLVSLDLFHAYDRVDLRWVDSVMAAMGFGRRFRGWIRTLHRRASARFMLHSLTPALLILFTIRQGDPLAMLLFLLQIEPLLRRLHHSLAGLHIGQTKVSGLSYVDDVAAVGTNTDDLPTLDEAVKDFESVSGAILNRNRKSVIVGLGGWADRTEWPLPWLHVAPQVKIYGFVFAPSVAQTLQLSWDRVLNGLEATLRLWRSRALPTLLSRRLALETFALSKLLYFALLLPLSPALLCRINEAVRNFLWAGRQEKLAMDEIHSPLSHGGLAVSCVASRATALRAKQACHMFTAGGQPRHLLAYWLGLNL